LVLSKEDYDKEMKKLNVVYPPPMFTNPNADACVIKMERGVRKIGVVCLRGEKEFTMAEVVGLLTHEAVHLFQWHCEIVGEHKPSPEFEAYSIQWLTQELFKSWQDQTAAKKKRKR
jgi:hypothetical protein